MKRLYVGNLAYNTSEADLRDEFARYGQVTSVKIVQDEMTGRPRGFGLSKCQTMMRQQAR